MAEVRVDFTVSAEKKVLTIIDKIMEAIEDVGMYGLENDLDEESGKLEVSADAVDLAGVCGWVAIVQKVFNENGMGVFSIKAKGVTDNDYYSYTAFELLCDNKEIKVRETDFDSEPSEDAEEGDFDDRMIEYEAKEEEAFEGLAKEDFRKVDEEDLYYEDEEYDAALEAFEDNVDSEDSDEDFDEDFDEDEED